MDQIIIGFAARKQAGKSTSYTCIRLWRPEAVEFSFSSPLKQMCVDILGVEHWQVYGTDEQKRTLVPHLLWENFPVPAYNRTDGTVFIGRPNSQFSEPPRVDTPNKPDNAFFDGTMQFHGEHNGHPTVTVVNIHDDHKQGGKWQIIHNGESLLPRTGPMTAREVLQYYGTEIFRKHYHNVWADACIRQIRKSGCPLAIITDCRFPNEVEAVQKAGGKVIKLTRNPFPEDNHPSETALDPENYDQNKFDYILDNAEMSVSEQCEAVYGLFRRWGLVEHKQVSRIHV